MLGGAGDVLPAKTAPGVRWPGSMKDLGCAVVMQDCSYQVRCKCSS